MFILRIGVIAVLPACVGGISTGIMMPAGHSALPSQQPGGTSAAVAAADPSSPTGVELHMFSATKLAGVVPNAIGYSIRQIGDEHVEQEFQIGWAAAVQAGRGFIFGRAMFDALSWQQRSDGDRQLSAFSPTLELGYALGDKKSPGWCLSGEVTRDVHLDEPDRTLVGAFIGLCSGGK